MKPISAVPNNQKVADTRTGLTGVKTAATNSVKIYYKTKACKETDGFNKLRRATTPGWS